MKIKKINHAFVALLPAIVTILLLQIDNLGSWHISLDALVEKHGLDIHAGWYNASVIFREKMIVIFYLVTLTLIVAFLYGYTENEELFVRPDNKTTNKSALLILILLLIATLFVLLSGRESPVQYTELNKSRLNLFLFNTAFGVGFIHLLCIEISIYIGGYMKLLRSR